MNKHIHKNTLSCYLLKILATECYTHTVFKSSISRRLKLLPDWHLGIVSGAHNTINRSSSYMSNPNGAELIENSLENIGGNLWPAHRAADATEPVPLLRNRYDFFISEIAGNFLFGPKTSEGQGGTKSVQKNLCNGYDHGGDGGGDDDHHCWLRTPPCAILSAGNMLVGHDDDADDDDLDDDCDHQCWCLKCILHWCNQISGQMPARKRSTNHYQQHPPRFFDIK